MKKRSVELDILRFLALLFVVCLHVSSSEWGRMPIISSEWLQNTIWRATWMVPIFVMISGRFFLDSSKQITIKRMYTHYIKRIVIAFVFWSAIYQVYYFLWGISQGNAQNWKSYVTEFLLGAYHMWYLFMLVGLYMITPILRKITEDKKLLQYFLLIAFIFHVVVYFGKEIPVFGNIVSTIMDKMSLEFFSGFVIYYLAGYYLCKYGVSKKNEIAIYIVGIILLIMSRVGDIVLSANQNTCIEYFTNYKSPATMVYSSAIFLFFVKRISRCNFSARTGKIFKFLTDYGFGAYLSHALIIELLISVMGLNITMLPPIIMIPILTLFATILSITLAFLLRRIPLIGRYIS